MTIIKIEHGIMSAPFRATTIKVEEWNEEPTILMVLKAERGSVEVLLSRRETSRLIDALHATLMSAAR